MYDLFLVIALCWLSFTLQWLTVGKINTFRLRGNGCNFADDIMKCIFLNEIFENRIKFHLSLFVGFQLTKSVGSDNDMAPSRQQAIIWSNDGLFYWHMYASLSLNALISLVGTLWCGIHAPLYWDTMSGFYKCIYHATIGQSLIQWALRLFIVIFQFDFMWNYTIWFIALRQRANWNDILTSTTPVSTL